MELRERIEELFEREPHSYGYEFFDAFLELKDLLNAGRVRAAEKRDGEWRVNAWVKKGILLGFRIGELVDLSIDQRFRFFDKHTFPLKDVRLEDGVRIVPGGSTIRDGTYLGDDVVCMPPMYVNVGAYVDDGTMIDSHALVGSCAQVGKKVHVSAAAQIGGVLEPVGSLPVIVEDEVLVGGNCGVYEGTIVGKGAILGAGVILTASTPVYDLVREEVLRAGDGQPLRIPEGAVIVPGSRPIRRGWGRERGLSLQTPVIVKYRDEGSDRSAELEELLR